MFTGIIEERGEVIGVQAGPDSAILTLNVPSIAADLPLGGSLAVNGVCLSITRREGTVLSMDVMGETLRRSTTGSLQPGDLVNLERCVPAGGRLDGHVVQGHVDGVGVLLDRESLPAWDRLRFAVPQSLAPYLAEKGSVAIDGVSLTITAVSAAAASEHWFEVGLIPVTREVTGLGAKALGATVNLEVDVLAKYAQRLLSFAQLPAVPVASAAAAAQPGKAESEEAAGEAEPDE